MGAEYSRQRPRSLGPVKLFFMPSFIYAVLKNLEEFLGESGLRSAFARSRLSRVLLKVWGPLKRPLCFVVSSVRKCLTSESVQGTALTLQSVDNVHGCDGLPLGMLGVGDGITDDILKEHLKYTTGLLVDQARDTLDSSTSRQTTDRRLGDSLDVITQHLPVTLGAPLSESLSSFTSSRHVDSSMG